MSSLVLIAALGIWPAFQPEMSINSRPLLWEAPISFQLPPASAATTALVVPDDLSDTIKAAREIQKSSGAAQAAAFLEKAEALELVLFRGAFNQSAGRLKSAQADYQKILASKNRTAVRALALSAYKNVLQKRIEAGEKSLYRELVKCLKDEWRNEEALDLLPKIWADPQVPGEIKADLAKDEPIMALRLGRYERAAELWAKPKGRPEIQWLAQTENRKGNFIEAAELRENLAKQLVGKAKNRELETAWSILAKGGLYDEAEALAGRHADIKKLSDYHWRSGLAALAGGRLPESRLAFETVLAQSKNKNLHSGARYYLARTLEQEGRGAEAAEHYRQLAAGNFDYYHILAQGRLASQTIAAGQPAHCLVCQTSVYNEKGLQLAAPMAALLESGPEGSDGQSLGFYLWLSEKGLGPEGQENAASELAGIKGPLLAGGKAAAALNDQLEALLLQRDWERLFELIKNSPEATRSPSVAARDKWLPLAATIAARGGDYRLAVSLMARIPNAEAKGLKRWSHPMVFGRQVRQAHRLYALPPALVLALIRTESAYQPDIMSASNARGLMQLLPATANKVAASLGEKEPGDLDLFDPDLNISYGTWYLAALVEGFDSVELALAGYNGGPYNIKSLIEAKEGMPLDVFIESLSFEETSKYVKRITESRYIYEMVYLGRAGLPDLTGPVRRPRPSLPAF